MEFPPPVCRTAKGFRPSALDRRDNLRRLLFLKLQSLGERPSDSGEPGDVGEAPMRQASGAAPCRARPASGSACAARNPCIRSRRPLVRSCNPGYILFQLREGADLNLTHPLPGDAVRPAQLLKSDWLVVQVPLGDDVALALAQMPHRVAKKLAAVG